MNHAVTVREAIVLSGGTRAPALFRFGSDLMQRRVLKNDEATCPCEDRVHGHRSFHLRAVRHPARAICPAAQSDDANHSRATLPSVTRQLQAYDLEIETRTEDFHTSRTGAHRKRTDTVTCHRKKRFTVQPHFTPVDGRRHAQSALWREAHDTAIGQTGGDHFRLIGHELGRPELLCAP